MKLSNMRLVAALALALAAAGCAQLELGEVRDKVTQVSSQAQCALAEREMLLYTVSRDKLSAEAQAMGDEARNALRENCADFGAREALSFVLRPVKNDAVDVDANDDTVDEE